MKLNDFNKLCAEWNQKMMESLEPKKTSSVKLLDFSGWLSEFEQSDQSSPQVRASPPK